MSIPDACNTGDVEPSEDHHKQPPNQQIMDFIKLLSDPVAVYRLLGCDTLADDQAHAEGCEFFSILRHPPQQARTSLHPTHSSPQITLAICVFRFDDDSSEELQQVSDISRPGEVRSKTNLYNFDILPSKNARKNLHLAVPSITTEHTNSRKQRQQDLLGHAISLYIAPPPHPCMKTLYLELKQDPQWKNEMQGLSRPAFETRLRRWCKKEHGVSPKQLQKHTTRNTAAR
ncbi:hypothetical protein [Aeoliella mucimassa]|uniref:Uncharacterized protein n=1 Tax=Aeoliella mucimassa TaxID=2527972 RepID=A0A518APR5_9BACT|nr:hypothetical protein [Aeoliella mucimassa]QDU56715.1 hypothetical protein Pan181_29250 [Aeoliella mucimassa]